LGIKERGKGKIIAIVITVHVKGRYIKWRRGRTKASCGKKVFVPAIAIKWRRITDS